jgi:hypothetical protein
MTIFRHRFVQPVGNGSLSRQSPTLTFGAGCGDAIGLRTLDEQSPVAIENDLFPILDFEQGRPQSDHHRHSKRARNYGRVRGDTSTGERYARSAQLCHVRGA